MMRVRALPLVVLVAAVTGLVASVGWAVARAEDGNGSWMMSRYRSGIMGHSASGSGVPVRDLVGAKRRAQRFADELGLRVGEVMRFKNNYYAELREQNGRFATELLVEPVSGAVYLEYGPAMMWNTRYGMMNDSPSRDSGGMMGGSESGIMGNGMMRGSDNEMMGGRADPAGTPGPTEAHISSAQAQQLAQGWLDGLDSKLTAGEPDAFPGYYTLHVLSGSEVAGMLSVNAATGLVWNHSWHGRFLSMLEG